MYYIRFYQPDDASGLLTLFCNTIRSVNSKDYSPEQIAEWANEEKRKDNWTETFKDKIIWVCLHDEQLAGFCELKPDGFIDRFYISHLHIGRGVGQKLYRHLEDYAIECGISSLFVHASITAKPFFTKMGFTNPTSQTVYINKTPFINFVMSKELVNL